MVKIHQAHIIHVKGAHARKEHLDNLLSKYPYLKPSFTEFGNINDLSPDILDQFFTGFMYQPSAFVSCAYKHILSLEKLVTSNENWALILEDDISFYKNFDVVFHKIEKEIATKEIANTIISLEDSLPKYIPRSKRIKGEVLYPAQRPRLAGAYLIDKHAAKSILDYIALNKCHQTWDWFCQHCIENKIIQCYWSQPAIACQGSLSGSLPSLIDNKKTGTFRSLNFLMQRNIKKLKAWFS